MTQTPEGLNWYVVQVKPGELERARTQLTNQDFSPFFPRVEVRVSRGRTEVQQAFRGYGFVHLDLRVHHWQAVRSTPGCIRLLPVHREYPVPVHPPGFVEHLLLHDPVSEDDLLGLFEEFAPGDVVAMRREGSVLDGRTMRVVSVRARLLEISFLSTRTTIGSTWVDKADVVSVGDRILRRAVAD